MQPWPGSFWTPGWTEQLASSQHGTPSEGLDFSLQMISMVMVAIGVYARLMKHAGKDTQSKGSQMPHKW